MRRKVEKILKDIRSKSVHLPDIEAQLEALLLECDKIDMGLDTVLKKIDEMPIIMVGK